MGRVFQKTILNEQPQAAQKRFLQWHHIFAVKKTIAHEKKCLHHLPKKYSYTLVVTVNGEKMKTNKEIPVEELEIEIIEFLDQMSNKPGGKRTKPGCNILHGKACALGTCVDDKPRVTPIDFFNEGLIVWIAGEPGGKIANIMRNPNVSVGIYEPVDHSREQKSLQIFGTAELINMKNDPDEFNRRFKQFGLDEAVEGLFEEYVQSGTLPATQKDALLEKIPKMFNWIKITPQKMIVLQVMPGKYPLKKTWEPSSATVQVVG
jgi:nitroimidazol reductase NimA-like FMN-containing flavoprotein (pyridoxamine 5'-phosphate oxidase superfamily)